MSKEIPLHGKYGEGKFAIVDDEDFDKCNKYSWNLDRHGYCYIKINQVYTSLHRFIMNHIKQDIDHINRNPLDNRKHNLRPANKSQNAANGKKHKDKINTKYKGVFFHKQSKKWRVQIMCNNKLTYIGVFVNEDDAAKAYDKKAKELFGEYAYLNFPD